QPDLTLDEIVSELYKRRIPGNRGALLRFFARHGITNKKICGRRAEASHPRSRAPTLDVRARPFLTRPCLVFIDETAVTTNIVRLNGWNPRGERLTGHWDTATLIAVLCQFGICSADADQRSYEWGGLPGLHRAKSGWRSSVGILWRWKTSPSTGL